MKEVDFFLANTSLRKSKKRELAVQSIRNHPQPMKQAKRLLKIHPPKVKLVRWDKFCTDLNIVEIKKGLPAPEFWPLIHQARAEVYNGTWTEEQHRELIKVLKGSYPPWSKEDLKIQKAQARMKKYAL